MALSSYYEDWTEQAACSEVGGDAWFPEVGDSALDAKKICITRCSVRFECLDFAMRREQGLSRFTRHGLYGGLSPRARAEHEPQWLAEQEVAA
jgi:WhiB family redox-sensing transcriptional regulator